jgi:hypothetical protein
MSIFWDAKLKPRKDVLQDLRQFNLLIVKQIMACRIFCTSVIETTALAPSDPDGAVRA